MSRENLAALRDLRRTRQRRRLGDTEWFDVAYRVYLFALAGLTVVIWASDAIDGFIGPDVTTDDLLGRGPSIVGIAVAVACALGVRSGADGGPISIEVADIRHVLLAPIDTRRAMLRPLVQRFRAVMFSLALAAAILGQFVAREVQGSRAAWAAAGAMFGALVGATFVASAVFAHAVRMPRWMATALAGLVIAWQCAAAWTIWHDGSSGILRLGPANLDGSIAFWGIRQRGIDVLAIAVTVAVALGALAFGGRLRLEPLARRGELVTQLRFAATVQDLRTVVMLRRQLRAETMRTRPWGARRDGHPMRRTRSLPHTIWIRGVRSLRRLPASRLGRIAALAIVGGVAASLTISSSPLFCLGTLAAIFLLGVEVIEPLSEEVDHPDITDAFPFDRGTLFAHHLVAPAALLAGAALVGAGAASVVDPKHAVAAFALALPVVFAGATGPIVTAVLDAPTPPNAPDTTIMGTPRNQEGSLMPPEFAGFGQAVSTLLPVILSALGVLPILAMRVAPNAGTVARSSIGVVLVLAVLVMWIRRRDYWSVKIRSFFAEGRAAQQAGRPS